MMLTASWGQYEWIVWDFVKFLCKKLAFFKTYAEVIKSDVEKEDKSLVMFLSYVECCGPRGGGFLQSFGVLSKNIWFTTSFPSI